VKKRSIVVGLILLSGLNGLHADENKKQPSLKQATQPVEELDDLGQVSSFKFGVGKKTLHVIDQQGDKILKAAIITSKSIKRLKEAGSSLIQKTTMGMGFLLSLAAMYYFLGSHRSDIAEKTPDNKTATPNRQGAIIGGLFALVCGCFLMR
jgi:hypothetical protein